VARTRTLTDEQILERVGTALGNSGVPWTLAGAAADAGLHPATLIKRFGSRHALLVALSRRWIDGIPRAPVTDDAHQELLAWAESLSPGDATAGQVLARVDMLIEDLRDPELRALLDQGWQRHLRYLAALIAGRDEQGGSPPPCRRRPSRTSCSTSLTAVCCGPPFPSTPRRLTPEMLSEPSY